MTKFVVKKTFAYTHTYIYSVKNEFVYTVCICTAHIYMYIQIPFEHLANNPANNKTLFKHKWILFLGENTHHEYLESF